MTTILWWLIQNTCTVALLVPIVALVCRSMRSRPALQHALWLVVLLKLVTPPLLVWPWSARDLAAVIAASDSAQLQRSSAETVPCAGVPAFGDPSLERGVVRGPIEPTLAERSDPADTTEAAQGNSTPRDDGATPGTDPDDALLADSLANLIDAQERQSRIDHSNDVGPAGSPSADGEIAPGLGPDRSFGESQPLGGVPPTHSWVHRLRESPAVATCLRLFARAPVRPIAWGIFVVWLAGALVSVIGLVRRVMRQWQLVRCGTEPPPHLSNELRQLAQAMQVRPLPARVVGGITTPLVWCVGWLRLLWPERLASASDVARCRGVIAHELAHVRRGDHWVARLELVAGVVWWWNPLFWLVRSRLRETAEIACDATALSVLPDGRRAYAEIFWKCRRVQKHRRRRPFWG